jgi:hypothetical protein
MKGHHLAHVACQLQHLQTAFFEVAPVVGHASIKAKRSLQAPVSRPDADMLVYGTTDSLRSTTVLLKARRGSERYQSTNSVNG